MNYTVKTEKGVHTLIINGVEAMCPYKSDAVVPGQNALGQMQVQVMRTPCSTECPFADYIKTENIHQYSIECTGVFKSYDIDETPEEANNRKNIIQI